MRSLLAALVLTGCGFSAGTSTPSDDTPATLCPFGLPAEYVDPCMEGAAPLPLEELLDVTITDNATIDTYFGELKGTNVFTPPPSSKVGDVRVIWTKNFTVGAGVTLRVYGELPIVIVATQKMQIDGTIDASSDSLTRGPGANTAACTTLAAGPGLQCANEGASGGGGGGFGGLGGAGGLGGNTKNCGASTGIPGGAGGKAIATRPSTIRGGCSGANGGQSSGASSLPGGGGFGGGGLGLIARESISVTGLIHAGGAQGLAGQDRAGGGGGGAGGMIFLEARVVDLEAPSMLAANGGAGAGGCDNSLAQPGENAHPDLMVAKGGRREGNSGDGGDGGVLATQAVPGSLGERGGGGGGGGVGFVRVHSESGKRNGMGTPMIQ